MSSCPCGGQAIQWFKWSDVPLVNVLTKPGEPLAPRYPLVTSRCTTCGTASLAPQLPPEILFPVDYPYKSGAARTFHEHADQFVRSIWRRVVDYPRRVLEIGSNDDTLANALRVANYDVRTVDPSGDDAETRGFFPEATREWPDYEFHAVTAFNVFAHIPDPVAFAQEAYRLLAPDGWFVVEVTELARILSGARLDTVYHEHMWYWSRGGLAKVLESVGFVVVDVESFPVQGGSMRVWAQKRPEGEPYNANEDYLMTPDPWDAALEKFNNRVASLSKLEGKWVGYGAAAKGAILADRAKLNLAYVIDETPEKQGLVTPYGAPIMPPEHLEVDPPDGIVILAWNYAREIREKLRRFGGQVIVA